MRIRPEQLTSHLDKGKLAPVYLITGDEPLQMTEALDALRKAAIANGYEERNVLDVSQHFDWSSLFQQADTLSLFASLRLLELKLGTSKPGVKGGKALMTYCEKIPQDTLLVITAAKIESASQKTKWFKALDNAGAIVQIWPVDANSLPQWIKRRFADRHREISLDATTYIADHVEGNMLAANQEIESILLLTDKQTLSLDDVLTVGDNSRYDVFKLVDAILQGHHERILKVLDGLRNEGLEPIIIHWALARELRSLYRMSMALTAGESMDSVLKKHRVWANRNKIIRTALQRHKPRGLQLLISSANNLERIVKGKAGDAWVEITWLCMRMAGIRLEQGLLKSLVNA